MIYCLIRVSTDHQDYERQKNYLEEHGYIDGVNCIYITETYTGKTTKRPVLIDIIENKLKPGDSLVACELSRISRSVKDFNNLLDVVLKEKKVNVIILKENFHLLANGSMDAMTKLILNITSAFAEFERDLISDRTKDALRAKKKNGTKSGRPIGRPLKKESNDENLLKTLKLLNDGESYRNACYITRFPKATLQLRIKQLKEKYDTNDLQTIINKLEKGE